MYYHVEHVFRTSKATGTAQAVLLYLAHRANESGQCWPSQAAIADAVNVTPRSAKRALDQLVELGELTIISHGGGRTHTTLYQVKGDNGDVKGDASVSVPEQERVTPVTERVTPVTERVTPVTKKGDASVTRIYQRKDKEIPGDIYNAPPMHSGIRYESEPPEPEYDFVALGEMKTAINAQVKDRMINTRREDELEALALDFLEQGVTLDEVSGFASWWEVNGYYNGLPAFKSFETEWANYRRGVQTASANGSEPKRHSTLERLRMQIMEESV